MSQSYSPLAGTDTFAVSYTKLNGSIDAAATGFIGPSAPPIVSGRMWIDTTLDEVKLGNEAGDGWITIGKFGTAYLGAVPATGGGMSGQLNMNGQTIIGLGLGTGTAAARQQELDLKAPIAAPVFTGDAQVNQDPAGNDSLVRRSWTEGRYLKLAGGTLTGAIVLQAFGGADYHPVALLQLKDFVQFNVTAGHRHDGADARKVRGADLDSGAAVVGQALMAQGSGASGFQALQQQPMRFLDAPVQLFSGTPPTTYTVIDVSANTDTDTYAAILRVNADVLSNSTFRFRKQGSSTDTTALDWGPVTGLLTFNIFVELSASRQLEWRALANVTFNAFKIHLVGYMRKNF